MEVWRSRVWWLPLLLVSWVLLWYVTQALTQHPDFDGALNLNVSRALLEGHGYASFYERMVLFPIETQTNGPYVMPAAVALALFGITPFGAQVVNLVYLLVFCALGWILLRRVADSRLVATFGVLLALQAPGMREYALNGYGEIPALAWMLGAVLALATQFSRPGWRWAWLGGALLGISFLTKTVSLIWFPPVVGIYLAMRWQRDGWRPALRDAIAGGVGIALALLAWEVFRLVSFGGVEGYRAWWDAQLLEIEKQAGTSAGYRDTPDRLIKIATHLRGLVGMLGIPNWAALSWLALLFVSGAAALRQTQDVVRRYLLATPLAVAACYLVWWLSITPTEFMWLRRILIALVLLQLLALAIAWQLRAHPRHAWRVVALGVALLSIWLATSHQLLLQRPDARAVAQHDAELFEAVRDLPADASVFGSGWWQSPVAALFSARPMLNEEAWDGARFASLRGPAFLVLDRYAVALGDHLRWRLGWRCDCEPVYVGAGGRIYRIHRLFESEQASAVRTQRLDAATEHAVSGFAAPEGGARWAEPEARLRLPPGRFTKLVLDYVVPDLAMFRASSLPLRMRVMQGACVMADTPLQAGAHSLLIENRCDADPGELRFEVNGQLDPALTGPDTRPLAWMFRGLELYAAADSR